MSPTAHHLTQPARIQAGILTHSTASGYRGRIAAARLSEKESDEISKLALKGAIIQILEDREGFVIPIL